MFLGDHVMNARQNGKKSFISQSGSGLESGYGYGCMHDSRNWLNLGFRLGFGSEIRAQGL